MKRLFISLAFILCTAKLFAIDYFQGTYEQAVQLSKTTNKNIFLYFTASWCGPCKYMDQYVFVDKELSSYVANNYIALKVEYETEQGKKLGIRYNVKGFPNFFVINSNESILKHKLGAMKLSQLKDFVGDDKRYSTPEGLMAASQNEIKQPLSDSVAEIAYQQQLLKKPGMISKFFFNAGVSRWKPGLKMGFNMSSLQSPGMSMGLIPGFYGGFFYDYTYKNFLFQPGLQFNSRGGTLFGSTNRLNYLELPLLLSLKIAKHKFFGKQAIRLNLIPYGALNLSPDAIQGTTLPARFKNFDYGAKAGLSFQMGTFEPSIGYDMGLANISNAAYKIHNRSYYFSIAVIIGK